MIIIKKRILIYIYIYRAQSGETPTVQIAAALFQELCYQNKDRMVAGIITAGWDKYNGGSVYIIPLGGSIHKQSFAIGGLLITYILITVIIGCVIWIDY